jgi:hypothetical protein
MKTIDTLKTTLSKFPAEFARGRASAEALAPFATIDELLGALALASSASHAERDAITLALITLHQRASHPLWQTLLLIAYEPMLANLLRRLRDRGSKGSKRDSGTLEAKDDAEQRVFLAFLEALQKVSLAHPPSVLALHLRHATERGVFPSRAESRQEPETLSLVDAQAERSRSGDLDEVMGRTESPAALMEREEEKRKLASELQSLFGSDAPLVLDVLLRARTGREPLVDLIAEWHPEMTPRGRADIYERCQRLRRRALLHLAARFGREAPDIFAA